MAVWGVHGVSESRVRVEELSVQVRAGMWRTWTRVSRDAHVCVLGVGHREDLV